ncbi:aquaporin [Candidatus Poseidoniaceae archaeon]|nr:aquaporin [Candidatus Poseidoniaceae archaeon]
MLRRCMAEFLGTALMVGIGCGSIALDASGAVVSISFGVAVTIAILLFQPISGAHINPAVSLAFFRSGHLEKEAVGPYIVAQLSGASFAAFLLDGAGPTTVADDVSFLTASSIEVFITFALMASIYWIVLRSQTHVSIAVFVGFVVAVLAYLFGPFTGASMNPARTFGPNIFSDLYASIPFYSFMTVCGALIAAELFVRLKLGKTAAETQD